MLLVPASRSMSVLLQGADSTREGAQQLKKVRGQLGASCSASDACEN